jgi:hypothetical protein
MQLYFVSGYTRLSVFCTSHFQKHFAAVIQLLASAGRISYFSTSFKVKVYASHTVLYAEKNILVQGMWTTEIIEPYHVCLLRGNK